MTMPDLMTTLRMMSHAVPSAAASTPARDLTQAEARDIVVFYALHGEIELKNPIAFGKDGRPSAPRIGEKVRLLLRIGGVDFAADSKAAANWTHTGPLDMRMAVLCVRLAHYLKSSKWGVTEIYWGGLGVGRDPDDRHGQGFALDFHGALTRFGKFDILRDWGNQKIILRDGKPASKWPVSQQPHFRLDVDTPAGGFFYDVYHFLTGQAADAARPSSIGDRSFILHPDTPSLALRQTHQDHIHCEIDR